MIALVSGIVSILSTSATANSLLAKRMVFAHYHSQFPTSYYNEGGGRQDYYAREYLTAEGEKGRWRDVGGWLRDRPLPVPKGSSKRFRVENAAREIAVARSLGIDGFHLDLFSARPTIQWETYEALLDAASEVDPPFFIIPTTDMLAFRTPNRRHDAPAVRKAIRTAYGSRSNLRHEDAMVFSAYSANLASASWWRKAVLEPLEKDGLKLAFWPMVQQKADGTQWAQDAEESGLSIGTMWWGSAGETKGLKAVTAFPQYTVHHARIVDEYRGAARFREQWQAAIGSNANAVIVGTWNDYSESTSIQPSVGTGAAYADLTSYFADWFKSGQRPKVTEEKLIWLQRKDTTTTLGDLGWAAWKPPVDVLDVTTLLKQPTTLEVIVPGATSPVIRRMSAGLDSATVPIGLGTPRIRLKRGSKVLYEGETIRLGNPDPKRPDYSYRGRSIVLGQ
jgi:hypothetical protein